MILTPFRLFIRTFFLLLTGIGLTSSLRAESPFISEFMAVNVSTLADEDGDYPDWIEIYNPASREVSLEGWHLTDSASNLQKWRFPAITLGAREFLVVFASSKDRRQPGSPLHTNFKLDAGGEYLALVTPDGVAISEYAPVYGRQFPDVAFGRAMALVEASLIPANGPLRAHIPADDSIGSSWLDPDFNDTGWLAGTNAAGFAAGGTNLVAENFLALRFNFDSPPEDNVVMDTRPLPSQLARNGTNNGAFWMASHSDTGFPPVSRLGLMEFRGQGANLVSVPAAPEFNSPVGSICFWVKARPPSGAGNDVCIFDRRSRMGDVIVMTAAGKLAVQATVDSGQVRNSFSSNRSILDDQWHHIAYVYDQRPLGGISLYIDGVLDRSQANSGPWTWDPAQRIELGRSHDSWWRSFTGFLDDFRIYTRMLQPAEIAQLVQGDGVRPDYPEIRTNLEPLMHGIHASAYLRFPFQVEDPEALGQLLLRVKYDDGFAAYVNGELLASRNSPVPLEWNSAATQYHGPDSSRIQEEIHLGAARGMLRKGKNVLAIHGLNLHATNNSFLLAPELISATVQNVTTQSHYFRRATPGRLNPIGSADLGPLIGFVSHTPNVPADQEDLLVTATVAPAFAPVAGVQLTYRIMYGASVNLQMLDDGLHGDGLAGDGIYGVFIPASASQPGEMIRYLITALDDQGRSSRWPLFDNPLESAEYWGTVVANPAVTSKLPIYQLFVQNPGAADSNPGTRASLFFDGEFYDNVFVRLKGGTTRNLTKKSHRVDFNREHRFRYGLSGRRLRELALNAEYVDPSYIRSFLSFETFNLGGTPAPVHFPVRLQMNGQFHQLAFANETLDEEMLERQGFDPKGSLYKNALMLNIIPEPAIGNRTMLEAEKVTRRKENYDDLTAFGVAIAETNSVANRRKYLFDHVDIPATINYMALFHITQQGDGVHANVCPYRDTEGTGEWQLRPWDMNISFGQVYAGNVIVATNDTEYFCHPFFGASDYRASRAAWSFHRLFDAMLVVPEIKEMYLRRLCTLMEEILQPPQTPASELKFERRIEELRALLKPEADMDRAKWGWDSNINRLGNLSFDAALDQIKTEYLAPRRVHLFETHAATNTAYNLSARIPSRQPAFAAVQLGTLEFAPASGSQAEEFLQLTNQNPYAVDISGWKLQGAVQFQFRPGTVIPAQRVLYVSPDVNAFRARTVAPQGGGSLFVQGPYEGQLSARGETITLLDRGGRIVFSKAYSGNPTPAQKGLRITEIMYHPASAGEGGPADAELLEYLELKNISSQPLDLQGIRFTRGIDFNFSEGSISTLAPGQAVLLVKDAAAFIASRGAGKPIAGVYRGNLNNGGERLRLVDGSGEEILDFSYDNDWHPVTDGHGFSLVIVNELASFDTWGLGSSWRPSGRAGGSPGEEDPAPPAFPRVLISEIKAHTVPPSLDTVEIHNSGAGSAAIGGWFLTDDFRTPKKYRVSPGVIIPPGGYWLVTESEFNPGGEGFSFSSLGEEVYLFSADSEGNLTGYLHGFSFGAAGLDTAFIRYVTSTGVQHARMTEAVSLGEPNPHPPGAAVVINEIMYRPPDIRVEAGTMDNLRDEYVELHNPGSTAVGLFQADNPENTWVLRGGIEFVFPSQVTIPAGGFLLLVNFDPSDPMERERFTAWYAVDPAINLLGPYKGKLSNQGDSLSLYRRDAPRTNGIPEILVDRVRYADGSSWPPEADGTGFSLHRRNPGEYGDDPINWVASAPSPGDSSPGVQSPAILTHPEDRVVAPGAQVQFSLAAVGTGPLRVQWRFNHQSLPHETNLTLSIPQAHLQHGGFYYAWVRDSKGLISTRAAKLEIRSSGQDSDQDGLPDLWESEHGLDPANATGIDGAEGDPDGDGLTNLQEYMAGTDPKDEHSSFRVDSIRLDGSGGRLIQFRTVAGKSYSILYKEHLGEPAWQVLTDIQAGETGTRTVLDGQSLSGSRFYRLVTPKR